MIVLDTHAWIWWVSDPDKLSRRARDAIGQARDIGLCPISCWEVATKVATGKLQLDRAPRTWVKQALANPRLTLLALTEDIAVTAGLLGREGFHGDPADRLIAATAMHHKAALVTRDKSIRAYRALKTIW